MMNGFSTSLARSLALVFSNIVVAGFSDWMGTHVCDRTFWKLHLGLRERELLVQEEVSSKQLVDLF